MKRFITIEDLRDVYVKSCQRGKKFIFGKLHLSGSRRTKSSFNETDIVAAGWTQVPLVRKRWNRLITGNEDMDYETFATQTLATYLSNAKMLSIGSGVCSHELKLATMNPNWEVVCVDFSEKLLQEASRQADKQGIKNIHFEPRDIYTYPLPDNSFDIVFFHQSLHHFKSMDQFLQRVRNLLKPGGWLMINEYVGADRMLYNKSQISAINEGLNMLDPQYRTIFKTGLRKNKYYGSGLIRMIVSDPSECVESERILPIVHQLFDTEIEKGYGGNILMPLLKDIAHHFFTETPENRAALQQLFALEDQYLTNHESDFIFGIYKKSEKL